MDRRTLILGGFAAASAAALGLVVPTDEEVEAATYYQNPYNVNLEARRQRGYAEPYLINSYLVEIRYFPAQGYNYVAYEQWSTKHRGTMNGYYATTVAEARRFSNDMLYADHHVMLTGKDPR